MGLKLRKFRGKLIWKQKSKEKVPEVVCLAYKINTDPYDSLPSESISSYSNNNTITSNWRGSTELHTPDTSFKAMGANEVVKHRKSISKPLAQNLFEADILTQNEQKDTHATTKKLGLPNDLKTQIKDDTEGVELQQNQKLSQNSEDYRKSILIFMTENHDEDHFHTTNDTREKKLSPSVAILKKSTSGQTGVREIDAPVTYKTTIFSAVSLPTNSDNLEYQRRETSESDFKVHFVDNIRTRLVSDLESEPESISCGDVNDDLPESITHYGAAHGYSSQAASIFFAGEEAEATPRVRNVNVKKKCKNVDNTSNRSHTSA